MGIIKYREKERIGAVWMTTKNKIKPKRKDKITLFGKRLRKLRLEKGWSQQELANKLGCSKSLISFYENAQREAGFTVLYELSEIFGVNAGYLSGELPEEPKLKKII